MAVDFTGLSITAQEGCIDAAELFAGEIEKRTGVRPPINAGNAEPLVCFVLYTDELPDKDSYLLTLEGRTLTVGARGIRGLIYGYSMFLRKTVYDGSRITLIRDIGGRYIPSQRIRGHQLGYRTTPNTYDAWSYDDYFRYYLDIMMFGCNTCEHIPYEKKVSKRNRLMRYDEEDFLVKASEMADQLDLDVSVWYPNNDEPVDEAVARRKKLFERIPRLNVVFPPGGDPGDFEADDFVERCIAISKALKQVHPGAQMWPSAQKPHVHPEWGGEFIECMEKLPDEIDGVITGPNRAFTLDELRRKLPAKYPIRLYTDITHNVRCEYPVHFNRDDWHFTLAAALSRESINPRPAEYRLIHRLTRRYLAGSVSYSEGVNDDVNKMVWSDMDFSPDADMSESLRDYARAFLWGLPAEQTADAILALELNWYGDPAENPHIESTYAMWQSLLASNPSMAGNWRFVMCLFRADCDLLVRRRRLFETALLERAREQIAKGELSAAAETLAEDFDSDYHALRAEISGLAQRLFELIGMQLDVEHYGADSAERGATLETVDLPVTDRRWLAAKLDKALTLPEPERTAYIGRVLSRNQVEKDEYYFSYALHGADVLGMPQEGEPYINFQGDRPGVNNSAMPVCMFKVYDNYKFLCRLGGFLPGEDYILRVTFSSKKIPVLIHHRVIANGVTIYDGPQFGGEKDEAFDAELLAPGFETASYTLPADVFQNGCVELEISEPIAGVMLSEFWVLRKNRA